MCLNVTVIMLLISKHAIHFIVKYNRQTQLQFTYRINFFFSLLFFSNFSLNLTLWWWLISIIWKTQAWCKLAARASSSKLTLLMLFLYIYTCKFCTLCPPPRKRLCSQQTTFVQFQFEATRSRTKNINQNHTFISVTHHKYSICKNLKRTNIDCHKISSKKIVRSCMMGGGGA